MSATSSVNHGRLPNGITREVLEQDGLRAAIHAQYPDVRMHDDDFLRASIAQTLAAAPAQAASVEGVWLFGYGSLLWNPCVPVAQWLRGRVHGYHRGFRIRLTHGRGSPDRPGLMLGLDPGGSCTGMGLRIDADDLEYELLMVWRREMLTGVYQPCWVWLHTEQGRVPALTFVTDTQSASYCGALDRAEIVRLLASGRGVLGTCVEYLDSTVTQLDANDIHDHHLRALQTQVAAV